MIQKNTEQIRPAIHTLRPNLLHLDLDYIESRVKQKNGYIANFITFEGAKPKSVALMRVI